MIKLSPGEAAALLRQKDDILILTHRRPDGDTTGCAAGLCLALRQLGKQAFLLKNPEVTAVNAVYVESLWAAADFVPGFVVSVDIAAKSLFFPAAEAYFDQIGLAVDHHPSFEGFGESQCVDSSRAACGEIVYEICRALGPVSPEIALPLYAAVATDTGCFVYANTRANTHRVAAELLETGIDYFAVNKRHFRTKSRKRIALEAELMGKAEFFQEGRGVFLCLPLEMMARIGASQDDLEDISSLAGIIEGVDCGAVLQELKPGDWKLSLRTGANGRVNATQACGILGGGGHAMAAGATVRGSLEQVKAMVLDAVEQVRRA